MKSIQLCLTILLVSFSLYGQKDYVITVDGKSYEIEMDGKVKANINGKVVNLFLKRKDTIILNEDYFELKYTKKQNISRIEIESGVEQIMMVTAGGSGVIVQKYDSFNPSMIKEMMLSEVTKESINYGYIMKREDYDKKLVSGETIRVLKAVLEYKDEYEVYEIASHGKKDEGILIMTMNMDLGVDDGGTEMIQLMWDTLKIK